MPSPRRALSSAPLSVGLSRRFCPSVRLSSRTRCKAAFKSRPLPFPSRRGPAPRRAAAMLMRGGWRAGGEGLARPRPLSRTQPGPAQPSPPGRGRGSQRRVLAFRASGGPGRACGVSRRDAAAERACGSGALLRAEAGASCRLRSGVTAWGQRLLLELPEYSQRYPRGHPTHPPTRAAGTPGRPFLPAPVPGPAARLSPSGHGRGLHPAGPLDMGGREEHWRGGGMQGG